MDLQVLKDFLVISFCVCFFYTNAQAQENKTELNEDYYTILNSEISKDTILSNSRKKSLEKYVKLKKYTQDEIAQYSNKVNSTNSYLYYTSNSNELVQFLMKLRTATKVSQTKERIVFIFEADKDVVEVKNDSEIYNLNMQYSFKHDIKKHRKVSVDFKEIKHDAITYAEFIKLNKEKSFPEYFADYTFYIFIEKDNEKGCLVEVEKIWLVESKIIN